MKRLLRDQQKELADQTRLLRAWKKFHQEERDQALAGPHRHMIERLLFIVAGLSQESAPLLVAYVRSVDWSAIDYPTRLTALHEINTAITRLRERNGQEPFDDGVPGERENVFRTIKSIVAS